MACIGRTQCRWLSVGGALVGRGCCAWPSGACASACVGGGARDPSAPGTAVFCYLNPTRVGARIDPLSTLLPAACGCAPAARARWPLRAARWGGVSHESRFIIYSVHALCIVTYAHARCPSRAHACLRDLGTHALTHKHGTGSAAAFVRHAVGSTTPISTRCQSP